MFDTVQKLMQKTKNKKGRQSSVSIFSSKIKCGECGSYYGSKVWHSNDKYRRVIWRCNHKFDNEKKCSAPHLDEKQIKEIFIAAVNKLIESKTQILADFELIKNEVFDTAELETERKSLECELEIIAEQMQECIDQNARVAQNQAEYKRQYNELVEKYDGIKAQVDELNTTIADKKARKAELELFMKNLETQDKAVAEFDENLWISMVESVTVYSKEDIRVTFKNGIMMKV